MKEYQLTLRTLPGGTVRAAADSSPEAASDELAELESILNTAAAAGWVLHPSTAVDFDRQLVLAILERDIP